MSYLYSDDVSSQILRPVPEEHEAWWYDHVSVPEGGLYFIPNHMTTGLGMNTSEATFGSSAGAASIASPQLPWGM